MQHGNTDISERSGEERTATAYHEAGHVVMGCVLGRIPQFVTIIPDGARAVGKAQYDGDIPPYARRYLDESQPKKRYTEMRVLTELAGSVALDFKEPGRTHDPSDTHDAHIAKQLVEELVSWGDHTLYLAEARQKTATLLQQHWRKVEAVAQALLQRDTLSRDDILKLSPPSTEWRQAP
jgi:ATP-dependent Zn protease